MPKSTRSCLAFTGALLVTLAFVPAGAAAPTERTYVPATDDVVLERLVMARGVAAGYTELRTLRNTLAQAPDDPVRAVAFARRAIELGREEADPRYFGYAESALESWWSQPTPPEEIQLLRATLRQQRHDFAGALVDLDALITADGSNAQARLTRAVVFMVQGQPKPALHDCTTLIGRTGLLTITTCIDQAKSLMGNVAEAGLGLDGILDGPNFDSTPAERSWSLTVAAELAQRRGDMKDAGLRFDAARAAVEQAGLRDPYLVTADADFLLEQGRNAEVVERLADYVRVDNALLRLALAEKALGSPAFDAHVRLLQGRFDETRQRGDTVHLREEAMFELLIRNDPAQALKLAAQNWEKQREPIDARIFVDAAFAAKEPKAAAPVLAWMQDTGIDDPGLLQRADKLRADGVTP